jgi:DNA repair protein RecO (recombination protein O)
VTTYRERAVILRKLDYGEADRIYTLLTSEHGKVPAIAKGVRRSASKLAPALELFAHVDVQLAHGRGQLDVVTQVVRLPGARVPADPDRMAHASLIAEVADRVSEDRHPIEGLYELTQLALDDLARDDDPRRASAYFLAQALEFLGYAPNLSTCVVCERALAPEPAYFSPAAGGLVCAADHLAGMLEVSVAALKVLRVAAAGDIALYRRLKLEPGLLEEVEAVLEAQIEHHLDRRLKSLQFLRRMRSPA